VGGTGVSRRKEKVGTKVSSRKGLKTVKSLRGSREQKHFIRERVQVFWTGSRTKGESNPGHQGRGENSKEPAGVLGCVYTKRKRRGIN